MAAHDPVERVLSIRGMRSRWTTLKIFVFSAQWNCPHRVDLPRTSRPNGECVRPADGECGERVEVLKSPYSLYRPRDLHCEWTIEPPPYGRDTLPY